MERPSPAMDPQTSAHRLEMVLEGVPGGAPGKVAHVHPPGDLDHLRLLGCDNEGVTGDRARAARGIPGPAGVDARARARGRRGGAQARPPGGEGRGRSAGAVGGPLPAESHPQPFPANGPSQPTSRSAPSPPSATIQPAANLPRLGEGDPERPRARKRSRVSPAAGTAFGQGARCSFGSWG